MKLLLGLIGAIACSTSAATAQAQVWVVDPAGALPQIRDAIELAASGDTILVKPGTYDAFAVVNKTLTIQGDPQAEVLNFVYPPFFPGDPGPAVSVRDLAPNQRVTIRGIDIQLSYAEPYSGLLVNNCAGPVHLENCTITSSQGRGVTASGCVSLTFASSTIESRGPFLPFSSTTFDPNAGLLVEGSNVYLYDSTVIGSGGHDVFVFDSQDPSDGGVGLEVTSGFVYASGSEIRGGQGGDYDLSLPFSGCETLGDGGPGMIVDEPFAGFSSRVVLFDSTVAGGASGVQLPGCALPTGVPGVDRIVVAGTVTDLVGEAHSFDWDSPVRESSSFDARYAGTPGNFAFLIMSGGPAFGLFYEPLSVGLHFDLVSFQPSFRGVLPATGQFSETLFFPSLAPARQVAQLAAQVMYIDPNDPLAAIFTSGPSLLTVVDEAY